MSEDYILCDFDGNVADSEIVAMDVACKGLIAEAGRQGITVPYDYVFGLFGKPIQTMMEMLTAQYGVAYKPSIKKDIHAQTITALSTQSKPVAGSGAFFEAARSKGKKLVIVTSSELDRVFPSLKCTGLKGFFPDDLIFSATTTLNPPQPKSAQNAAIYLYTLKTLGIGPEDTHTSEDSPSGTGSAHLGNVACFGNLGGSHIKDREAHAKKLLEAGAVATFTDWRELIPLLSLSHREIHQMRRNGRLAAAKTCG